ncbi:uncharacterized protein LOC119444501 isoform X4 [Dermacentor silvarum]|uniref:uncharacterized protein LOC119444501 isoform X4 n=1 Tax=Dermacentor silvarum TaxID=543639 RepID=UPI0021014E9D|nr:uncharacterized protein LOC119444501 isoform X4 [Dermacentor silvarum]XP_049519340.1 uncharacterized protein LOC119444501 isoform X4 [Dermacentor silvarum]
MLETRVDKGIAGLLVEQPVDMASRTTSSGPQHVQVDKGIAGLLVEQPVDMASRTTSSGPQHVQVDKGVAGLLVEQPVEMARRTTSSGPQHVQGMAPNHDVEIGMSSSLHSAGIGSNCASSQDDEAHDLAEFSPTPDGRFHLCKGVKITADQAAKILRNKKATIVKRDTAQAIWGLEAWP